MPKGELRVTGPVSPRATTANAARDATRVTPPRPGPGMSARYFRRENKMKRLRWGALALLVVVAWPRVTCGICGSRLWGWRYGGHVRQCALDALNWRDPLGQRILDGLDKL
jgi:hypothetical protein